jgi:uncharacterized surface protein with fasciclin (FAS1) repeats
MKFAALLATLAVVSAQPRDTITELLARDPYLRTLDFAVRAGGLAGALNASSANGLTLFAPDDRAFEALGRNIMDYLVNKDHIKQLDSVLTYHVHNAAVYAGQLYNNEKISTLNGGSLTVTIGGGAVKINTATVVRANLNCTNGVVHAIDAALVPSDFSLPPKDILTTAVATADLATLVVAVKAANLTAALAMPNGPYVVFAPTNEAFAKIPTDTLNYLLAHPDELRAVLFYHIVDHRIYADEIQNFQRERTLNGGEMVFIVNGSGVFVDNTAKVIAVNVDCTNGVVHLIDTVLIPAKVAAAAAAWVEAGEPEAPELSNIVALAEATPDLSTLVVCIKAAGLANTLSGPGPFTVLAPVNDAFKRLPAGVVDYLLNHTAELKNVLLYHGIAGAVQANQITNDEHVPSLFAKHNLTFNVVGPNHNVIIVDQEARVITPDVEASNGVVHLIDRVLLPRGLVAKAKKAMRGAF